MGGGWSGVCGSLAVPDALVPSVFPVGLWMGPGATPGTRGSEEAWLALSLLWANSEGRPVRGAPLPALPSCMPHTCCPSPLTPAHSGRVRCPSISPRETDVHGMWSLPPLPQRGACGHGGAAEAWVSAVVQGVSAARVWAPLVDWPPRKSGCTLALEAHPALGLRRWETPGSPWRVHVEELVCSPAWEGAARPRGRTSPSCGQIPDPQDPDTAGRPGRPPRSGSRDVSGSQCIENVFALSCRLLSVQWQSLQNNVHLHHKTLPC